MSAHIRLNNVAGLRVIVSVDGDASETEALRTTIHEFRIKSLNLDEVLIAILVLYMLERWYWAENHKKLTSVYWPKTSTSSYFVYSKSVR